MPTKDYYVALGVERRTISLMSDPGSILPSGEALQERFSRNFSGFGVPKGERIEGLNMDLILTEDEAVRGLDIQVRVPAPRPCDACGGTGRDWAFTCISCEGQGVIDGEAVVPVQIPPHVRAGSVVELPLAHLGIRNLVLCFHVSVTGARDPLPFG